MSIGTEARTLRLLLSRFTFRHWWQAPVQSAVLVLILALGIGVFFAMRLANRAVLAGFENFSTLVQQESDWVITSPAGSLPEGTLREIRTLLGARPVHLLPVLEITGAEPATGDEDRSFGTRRVYTLIGVDLVALANLGAENSNLMRSKEWPVSGPRETLETVKRKTTVFISSKLAQRLGLSAGNRLPVVIHDRVEKIEVAGVIPRARNGAEAPESMVVMDLPELQRLAQSEGRVERIECLVEPGANADRFREEARAILEANAHGRWTVSSRNERRETAAQMTQALRLNLTLLSTLALLVGFYFIHQALDGAVVRRREEIATLRSLGITEGSIRRVWVCEAVLLGLAGGSVGGIFGWLGAQGTVRLVSRSVNALYQASQVEYAPFHLGEFGFSLLLGAGFSVLAGWFPAREAARTPPAQVLRRHAMMPVARLNLWRVLIFLTIAVVAASYPPVRRLGGATIPVGGYVATLFGVLAMAAASGHMLAGLARLLAPWTVRSAPLRIAVSQLRQPAVRHVIAASCLLSAVAMTGGMAILVGSYDLTMRAWLARSFMSDLYISSEGAQSASSTNRLRPETWRPIAADPGVADFYTVQMTTVTLPGGTTLLAGGDLGFIGRNVDMSWLQPPGPEAYDAARNAGLALASEAFMRRFRKKVGEEVAIPTPAGEHRVRLAGVFADYGNERGTLLIDRKQYAAWWGNELIATITLKLRPGVNPEAIRAQIRRDHPELNVFTNRALREQALRIFQETFAVTYALEIIGVTVAVTGLGLTLASIFLQRRGDLMTLRALAWTRGEIATAATAEGLLLSLAGLAAGLMLSVALGALLVFVINRQSFGWTLQFHIPWGSLTVLSVLVLASGAAASFIVGRWAAQLPGDREE